MYLHAVRRCLPLLLVVVILSGALNAQDSAVSDKPQQAEKLQQPTREQLQALYMEYLKKEGYVPEIDEDGDVMFKYNGGTYFVAVDEEDLEFFQVVFPNFWEIESVSERQQALEACDKSNRDSKVSKIYLMGDNTWGAVEIFVQRPDGFKPVFKRAMSALENGVETFVKEMRGE